MHIAHIYVEKYIQLNTTPKNIPEFRKVKREETDLAIS